MCSYAEMLKKNLTTILAGRVSCDGFIYLLVCWICFMSYVPFHFICKLHDLRVGIKNTIFLFLKQNICCGYSK